MDIWQLTPDTTLFGGRTYYTNSKNNLDWYYMWAETIFLKQRKKYGFLESFGSLFPININIFRWSFNS